MDTIDKLQSVVGCNSKPVHTPSLRLTHIDGLRGLAALYVVMHHAWLQIYPVELGVKPTGIWQILTHWLSYGHYAVTAFIVISGFCLALPYGGLHHDKPLNLKAFAIARCRRLLPPYYASLTCCLILIELFIGHKTGTHWDVSVPVDRKGIALHLLLLNDLRPNSQINHVFWSQAVEFHIYLFFPLFLLAFRRFNPVLFTMALNSVILLVIAGPLQHSYYQARCPQYYGLFVAGMLAGYSINALKGQQRKMARSAAQWIAALTFLAAILFLKFVSVRNEFVFQVVPDDLIGIATASLLFFSTDVPGTTARWLCFKPLVRIGIFSYSIYLIHAPLLQIFCQYALFPFRNQLGRPAMFVVLEVIGVPVVIGASYGFFWLFERPFLSKRARESPNVAATLTPLG